MHNLHIYARSGNGGTPVPQRREEMNARAHAPTCTRNETGRGEYSFWYSVGVLQGCPLGLHGLCLALWDFVTELDEKLREVNSCGVWIADDLTVVAPRNQCGTIIRYIRAELPKYNMETSKGKLYSYLVGPPHSHYSDLLRGEGFRVNNDGLQRLLGAPIGTRQFQIRSAADGGPPPTRIRHRPIRRCPGSSGQLGPQILSRVK